MCETENERQRWQDGSSGVGGRVITSVTEYWQCWPCESQGGGGVEGVEGGGYTRRKRVSRVSGRMDDMQDVQKRLTGHVSQPVCVGARIGQHTLARVHTHTPNWPQV